MKQRCCRYFTPNDRTLGIQTKVMATLIVFQLQTSVWYEVAMTSASTQYVWCKMLIF